MHTCVSADLGLLTSLARWEPPGLSLAYAWVRQRLQAELQATCRGAGSHVIFNTKTFSSRLYYQVVRQLKASSACAGILHRITCQQIVLDHGVYSMLQQLVSTPSFSLPLSTHRVHDVDVDLQLTRF